MDPMLDARLKAIEETLEKNQEVLLRIRRVQRNSNLFKLFYWILIILAAFGSLYFIKPYLMQIIESYTGMQNTQEQFKSISDFGSVNDIIKQLRGGEMQQ